MLNRTRQECDVCGARVKETRRGRCWGCYARWVEARPVGLGASCVLCGDRRREILKTMEMYRAWLPVCFNCAGKSSRLPSLPEDLHALRHELARERRRTERRESRIDSRVFPRERRRTDDRRYPIRAMGPEFLAEDDDILTEVLAPKKGGGDETRIVPLEELERLRG